MRSKILLNFPKVFLNSDSKKKSFKQIKELGFDQLVLDASYLIKEKNIKESLCDFNLVLFAANIDSSMKKDEAIVLMDTLHTLDCSYLIPNQLLEESSMAIFEESGLKQLAKRNNIYCKPNNKNSEEPFIVENPLSYQTAPLQSQAINESETDKETISKAIASNLYFLISPDPAFEKAKYLMYCKDILNRFYFLGVR